MNQGTTIFAQILAFIDYESFRGCVRRYDGDLGIRQLSCWDQFLAMAFAQLTYRESLRDIEVCLTAQRSKLYHCGLSGPVRRSSLADANEDRDWRIYADFAHTLIDIARPLYADTDLGLDLRATAYALDATTIDLCLSMFPWARFRKAKGAIKLHTMIEIHSSIPVFIDITHGKVHDVKVLDILTPEPGSFLVMDRGYLDFAASLHSPSGASFLRHPSKKQSPISSSVLSFRGQIQRREKRPDRHLDWTANFYFVSCCIASSDLLLGRDGQAFCLSDQQLFSSSSHRRQSLPFSLANRTLFQMDQAASTNQTLLWHFSQTA